MSNVQTLFDGPIFGLTIGLLAVGFAAAYLPTRVYHLALGAVYALVPFAVWYLRRQEWPLSISIFIGLAIGVAVSVACEALNHWPLQKRDAPAGVHMISSLGIYIVVVQVIVLLWGNETKVLRRGLDPVFHLGQVVITQAQSIAVFVSGFLFACFAAWLRLSRGGLLLRALAENPREFALRGYNARQTRLVAFAWSGLLAGSSALVVANDTAFVPYGGLPALLLAIVATILGARLGFLGALGGGVALGVLRSQVAYNFSARWQEAFTFLLLIVFLLVRSGGQLGPFGQAEGRP